MNDTAKAPRNTGGAIARAAGKAAAAKSERVTMQNYVQRMLPEIAKALPSHIGAERFTRNILSLISSHPELAKCTPASFLGAVMVGAQYGLDVGPVGEFYIVPFENKKERCFEAVPVIGYKGYVNLMYRSGMVESVQAHAVRERDEFTYSFGLHPDLVHVPARSDRGEIVGAYAVLNLKGGGFLFDFMSLDELIAHRKKYAKAGASSPWETAFEQMACKTVLRRVAKLAPLSTEIQRKIAGDEAVKTSIAPDMSEIEGAFVVDEASGEVIADVREEAGPAEEAVQTTIKEGTENG